MMFDNVKRDGSDENEMEVDEAPDESDDDDADSEEQCRRR